MPQVEETVDAVARDATERAVAAATAILDEDPEAATRLVTEMPEALRLPVIVQLARLAVHVHLAHAERLVGTVDPEREAKQLWGSLMADVQEVLS